MKKIIVLLIFFKVLTIYAQSNEVNSVIKNNQENAQILKIENGIKDLKIQLKELSSKNDSLNKELLYFKVKEDYYSTALSEQSTKFSLIISIILALLTLFSWGFYKYELNKIEKNTKDLIKKYKTFTNAKIHGFKKTEIRLNQAESNLYFAIAYIFSREKKLSEALESYIIGIDIALKRNDKSNDYSSEISNLKECIKILNYIEKKDLNNREGIKLRLNNLNIPQNSEINDLVSEIRYLINKI